MKVAISKKALKSGKYRWITEDRDRACRVVETTEGIIAQVDARKFLRKSGIFTRDELETLEGESYWDYYYD